MNAELWLKSLDLASIATSLTVIAFAVLLYTSRSTRYPRQSSKNK